MASFTKYFRVCWICLLYLALSISSTSGRQLSVSQGTFGGSLGRLIASTDASLTNETKTLGGLAESCQSTMANKATACESCLNSRYLKQICTGISWISGIYQTFSSTISTAGNAATRGIANARTIIGGAGKAIYKKYGEKAINALKAGFDKAGGYTIVNAIQNGVNIAKNAATSAANKAKSVVKKIFNGWRKRRSLTDMCYMACPDCRDPGCASAIENKFAELKTRVANYEKLVKDWDSTSEAGRDLLKETWVNESTHKVSKIVVWRDSAWKTYHPSDIAVDLYNQDAMYDAIALYIMNSY